jgi:hypothetical protein
MIYANGLTRIPQFTENHDRNSKIFYGFIYRPQTRLSDTVYLKGAWALPSEYVGWYLEAVSAGKSAGVEPAFDYSKEGAQTKDGTKGLIWAAKPYVLLPPGQKLLESEWTAHDVDTDEELPDVLLDSDSFTDDASLVRLAFVPATLDEIVLTNRTVRGANAGDPEASKETVYRSLHIKMGVT